MTASPVHPPPATSLLRHSPRGEPAHFDWLVARGVPYKASFYYGQSGEPPTDDGLVWSGSENVAPFRDVAKPAPRGHGQRGSQQHDANLRKRHRHGLTNIRNRQRLKRGPPGQRPGNGIEDLAHHASGRSAPGAGSFAAAVTPGRRR